MSFPEFRTPETIDQAVAYLSAADQKTLVFGGGTLVQPLMTLGTDNYDAVIDLEHLALDKIVQENNLVTCGAMVRLADLGRLLPEDYIQAAVASIGGPAVRNLATVAGNLFAKPPYGDLATLLLALGTEVELVSSEGSRWLSLEEFYLVRNRSGSPEHHSFLVTYLRFNLEPKRKVVFRKLGRKQLNSASVVAVAVSLEMMDQVVRDARIALGGVDAHPVRALSAEQALIGSHLNPENIASAAQAARADCHPGTDSYASAWYREKMVPVQVRRALQSFY